MDAKIESGIRIAKFTAIAAGILYVAAVPLITPINTVNPFPIVGSGLLLGCAYGIGQKSRFCAMAAFSLSFSIVVYRGLDLTGLLRYSNHHPDWMPPSWFAVIAGYLICSILLYKGIWATIIYHDRRDRAESSVPSEDVVCGK